MALNTHEWCHSCGQLAWYNEKGVTYHTCHPMWEWKPGDEHADWEDFDPVRAYDAESAAEKAAEQYDCSDSDYPILRGSDIQMWVRRQDQPAEVHKFHIRGESVPTYYANLARD